MEKIEIVAIYDGRSFAGAWIETIKGEQIFCGWRISPEISVFSLKALKRRGLSKAEKGFWVKAYWNKSKSKSFFQRRSGA